jgi:hypothetical protein
MGDTVTSAATPDRRSRNVLIISEEALHREAVEEPVAGVHIGARVVAVPLPSPSPFLSHKYAHLTRHVCDTRAADCGRCAGRARALTRS